jgi:hypothetical protein
MKLRKLRILKINSSVEDNVEWILQTMIKTKWLKASKGIKRVLNVRNQYPRLKWNRKLLKVTKS